MRFLIFLVSLCCLLLKGDTCICASTIHNDIHYAHNKDVSQHPRHTPKKQSANSDKTSQGYSAIEDVTMETDNIISDDAEDEDLIKSLAAKHKQPARRSATNIQVSSPSYLSFLSYHSKYCNAPPSLFGQISYKYLILGVFKI